MGLDKYLTMLDQAAPLVRELANDKTLDKKLHDEAAHLLKLKAEFDKTGSIPNADQFLPLLKELKDLSPLLRNKLIDKTTADAKEAVNDQKNLDKQHQHKTTDKWAKNVLPDLQLIDGLNSLGTNRDAQNRSDVKAINNKLHAQHILEGTTIENVLSGKK
jgi:hypothetical protein